MRLTSFQAIDDTWRGAFIALGVGLMLAAVGWVGSVTLSASYCWTLRFLPPVALCIGGAALMFLMLGSRSNPRQDFLDKSIEDGRTVAAYTDALSKGLGWEAWQKDTFAGIKDRFGLRTANEFAAAGIDVEAGSEYSDARLSAQIAFLGDLSKRDT